MMLKNRIVTLAACFTIFMLPKYLLAEGVELSDKEWFCVDQWTALNKKASALSEAELIEYWKGSEKECKGTSFYEAKLALLYRTAGDFEKATITIEDALKNNTDSYFSRLLKLERSDIALNKAVQLGIKTELGVAEEGYQNVINEYPDWYEGYEQMAALCLLKSDYTGTIEHAEKAVSLTETAFSYRNLAVAYQNIGKYQQSIDSMLRAYDLDSIVFGDLNMMLSASISYAKLGKFELSRNSLAVLMQNNPGVENNKNFLIVASYVKKMIKKAGITSPEELNGRDQ